METVAQIFGIGFVCIIMICIVITFGQYIIGSMDRPGKRNNKLLDNMNKLKHK